MYEQGTLSISAIAVVIILLVDGDICCLGSLAPPNGTVIAVVLAPSLSASGAIL